VARGAAVERHPVAKDATDLELAFRDAVGHGAERVVLVGGDGGRLDHLLANILLLASSELQGRHIDAFVGPARLAVARGGEGPVEIGGEPGSLLTLLPLGATAVGVVTTGLEYPLHHEDLECGSSRGVSNVMLGSSATVALALGTLLVVQPTGGVS
jgi:thiamine pyrophosphokinase